MLSLKHIATYLILAGAIKVWQSGEDVTSTDLNANFAHIHGKMVGGHGARLVDADVNPSANIAVSKIALTNAVTDAFFYSKNALTTRAWAATNGPCISGTCALSASKNITSIVWNSTGTYTVTPANVPTNVNYAVFVTSNSTTNTCVTTSTGATTFNVICDSISAPAVANSAFSVLVFDND